MEKAYFLLIGQLLSYLLGETQNPPTTGEEGLDLISVLEAAARSVETGRAQPVE
jgi:predicted dehydrogenase